jgi:uncharacterized protein YuzE
MKKTIGILLLILPIVLSGQDKLKKKTIRNSQLGIVEIFQVLKSDKSIRHGKYVRSRNGKLLSDGTYNNGQKELFKYYESNGSAFLEYDYLERKIINYKEPEHYEHYIDIHNKAKADQIPLPLFSLHELRIFIAMNVRYPVEAQENGLSGKSKIALKIGENGEVIGLSVFESSHLILDMESLRVLKSLPNNWSFIPAIKDDKVVESYVIIPVSFILA